MCGLNSANPRPLETYSRNHNDDRDKSEQYHPIGGTSLDVLGGLDGEQSRRQNIHYERLLAFCVNSSSVHTDTGTSSNFRNDLHCSLLPMASPQYQKKPSMDVNRTNESEVHKLQSYTQGTVNDMQLDPTMEKKILQRFDMFLLPQIAIIIVIGYLDRSNIGETLSTPTYTTTEEKLC